MKTYRSFSSEETRRLGKTFAEAATAELAAQTTRSAKATQTAIVYALSGDLGAGKTTFVQGFLKGLGAKGRAMSPTFVIMRRHPFVRAGRKGREKGDAFHIDAYRLKKARDLVILGIPEILKNPRNVVLVEWAEKIKPLLPQRTIFLRFQHGKKENERRIIVVNRKS